MKLDIEQLRRMAVETCAANPRHAMADQHFVGLAMLALLDEIDRLATERDAARALLREREWSRYAVAMGGLDRRGRRARTYAWRCWECVAGEPGPHAPDCAWKRAMGET